MEAREIFPVFSELHADSAEPTASPDATERVGLRVLSFAKRPKRHERKKRRNRTAHPPESKSRSIERGQPPINFDYEQEMRTDTQKAILAVAYLLEWSSDVGNCPVEGFAAEGLSILLRKCASSVGRMFTLVDLRAAGGDPKELQDSQVRR